MYKTIQSTLAKFTKLAKFAKFAKLAQYSTNSPARVTKIRSILDKFAGASHKKMANFWRVLEFAKFAGKWPLLKIISKVENNHKFFQISSSRDIFIPYTQTLKFKQQTCFSIIIGRQCFENELKGSIFSRRYFINLFT